MHLSSSTAYYRECFNLRLLWFYHASNVRSWLSIRPIQWLLCRGYKCEIKSFKNNLEIISVFCLFYFAIISHITRSETEIILFQPLKYKSVVTYADDVLFGQRSTIAAWRNLMHSAIRSQRRSRSSGEIRCCLRPLYTNLTAALSTATQDGLQRARR